MNYFELFEIPVQLNVDKADIQKKFYALSRKYHPDFFSQATEIEQQEVLERSSLLNKAWKTFQRPEDTIKYVLQLKQLLEEEEKYELPPSFLMNIMDINEHVMEAKSVNSSEVIQALRTTIDQLQKEMYEPVKEVIENYQEGITTKEELLQVKDYYYKKKYLYRILDGLP